MADSRRRPKRRTGGAIVTKQPSALENPLTVKLLAQRLRQMLMVGYQPEDSFAAILASLTDEDLVARYANTTDRPRQQRRGLRRETWS